MNYKELLFNKDKALTFYPDLAVILNEYDKHLVKIGYEINGKKWKSKQCGLNAAIVVNQINYWNELNEKLKSKKHFKDGYYWTYHAYDKWAKEDFPFWSGDTVRRAVKFLEDIRLVISTDEYNSWKADNTKWYRIDFEKLQEIINIVEKLRKEIQENEIEKQVADTVNADYGCVLASCTDGLGSVPKAIPEITSENTNRDYSSEITPNSFSNEKDNSQETWELHNSHFPEEQKNESRISMSLGVKQKQSKEKPLRDILTRAKEIADSLVDDTELSEGVQECISYFLEKYKRKNHREHLPLRNETLQSVAEVMLSSLTVPHDENLENRYQCVFYPLVSEASEWEDRKEVIDKYFDTDFREKCDYSLVHFTQRDIITHVMQKCSIGEDIYWFYSESVD